LMKKRLQERVSFGVGKDRYAEGRRLEANGVDVFILDDGFQHLRLARDADMVLVDSTRPLRNEFVLPAGRLREPTSALYRANLVVFTRTGPWLATVRAIQEFPQLAIYPSSTKLLGFRRHGAGGGMETLRATVPESVFAFCGIGNPDSFFADLQRWDLRVAGSKAFRDHHRYTKSDATALEAAAKAAGAKALVTTEKDAQNIGEGLFSEIPVEVVVIAMEIADENQLMRDLRARLPTLSGANA
jgi:tetraacyldisaccharide 4'-kinase